MNLKAATTRLLVLGLPLLLLVQNVFAAGQPPPTPDLRKSPAAWVGIFLMVVLVLVVLIISLWPSKRGHQD